MDGTWIQHYTSKNKKQSKQWIGTEEPDPNKLKTILSVNNVLLFLMNSNMLIYCIEDWMNKWRINNDIWWKKTFFQQQKFTSTSSNCLHIHLIRPTLCSLKKWHSCQWFESNGETISAVNGYFAPWFAIFYCYLLSHRL